MRIQHNITALNAHRNLSNNNSAVGKNLEKLSSGFRINRAGDDAAGLAISEKMRAQITGLQTAQKNAEDGVSLVQTAEGALTEVHSMLNRMVELATQAANGTYSEANRQEMQKEIDALNSEIDRISNTSNFNGTNLFGGAGGGVKLYDAQITANKATVNPTKQTATAAKFEAGNTWNKGTTGGADAKFEMTVTDATGATTNFNIELGAGGADKELDDLVADLNKNDDLNAHGIKAVNNAGTLVFESVDTGSGANRVTKADFKPGNTGATMTATNKAVAAKDAGNAYDLSNPQWKAGDKVVIGDKTYTWDQNGDGTDGVKFKDLDTLKVALEKNGMTLENQDATAGKAVVFKEAPAADAKDGVNITLHVGESSSEANGIVVNIKSMSTKSLGIDKVDITKAASAKTSIDIINKAIDDVSSIRSDLGALQNRLEHTINNLGVQTENITAAESRIRDVDMAKEMMAYTKNNILVQASQAMLAQANQVPQGVLQLLQ